jgi:putative glycosyltransferase (TIGR04372 family)
MKFSLSRFIKFGYLYTNSIGHMCCEADLAYLKNKRIKKLKVVWLDTGQISNSEMFKLISHELYFVKNKFIRPILEKFIHISRGTKFDANAIFDDFTAYVQDDSQVSFPIPVAWDKDFNQLKEKLGLKLEKYVCIAVRDSLYSEKFQNSKVAVDTSYRNSNLNTYKQAIYELIESGYEVVKVGSIGQKTDFNIRGFIDYTNSGFRSERADILLLANCSFSISTGTGIDEIATLYRKPVYLINTLPVGSFRLTKLRPYIFPKYLRFKTSKNYLTLDEISTLGLWNANSLSAYSAKGVEVVDLSERDLVAGFREILELHEKQEFYERGIQFKNIFRVNSQIPQTLMNLFPIVSQHWNVKVKR